MKDDRFDICEKTIIPKSSVERLVPLSSKSSTSLVEKGVLLAGISSTGKGFQIGRVRPPFHLVLFTRRGKGLVVTPDKVEILKPGDMLIVPARTTSHVHCTHEDSWEFIFFRVADNHKWVQLRDSDIRILPNHNIPGLEFCMGQFIYEALSNNRARHEIAALYAELMMIYLDRELDFTETPHDVQIRERFSWLWNMVDSQLQKKWTIDELSAHIAMSRTHFFHMCMKYHRRSPMQMITRFRMERAKSLLKGWDIAVGLVAELVGYTDPYAFSVAFKRCTGLSPTEYRNS